MARNRSIGLIARLASVALLATVLVANPASSAPSDRSSALSPSAVDPAPDLESPGGMSAAEMEAAEAAMAAEISDDVVMSGTPIVPQGATRALDGDAATPADDNVATLTTDPAPAGSADAAPAVPAVNRPEPGTESSISFADSPVGLDADLEIPPYVQLEIDTAKRSRIVRLDSSDLVADLNAAKVSVQLFDDVVVDLQTTVAPSEGAMSSQMYGALATASSGGVSGANEAAVLTVAGDDVIGGWWKGDAHYGIFPLGNGDHVVFESGRQFADDPEAEDLPAGPDNGPSPLSGGLSEDTIGAPNIEVMVAYDVDALAFYGGSTLNVTNAAIANINLTNITFLNSQMAMNMTLSNVYATGWNSNLTNLATYRNQMANKTDGTFDAMHGVRDSNGADLVVLLTDLPNTGLCGIAFFPTSANPAENDAYSVTQASCATTAALTFPHEIGHNMCAGHDVTGGGCSFYTVDLGYVDAGTSQRTIMARNSNTCCTRRPVWSNPSNTFNGWVTGVASTDNAFVMEQEDQAPGTVSGGVALYRTGAGLTAAVAGVDGISCVFSTIEDAITLAAPGSTIFVAPGTYPAQSSGLNYNVSKDLDIVQGTSLCEPQASPVNNAVILTRNASATTDAVFEVSGSGTEVRLDHITIQDSTGIEGNVQVFSGATLNLDESIVRNANTTGDGGGVRVLAGGTFIGSRNYQVENNTSSGNGGGIYVDGGTVILDGLGDVDNNDAVNGGGIYAVNGATVDITNDADVLSNTASGSGGGVYASGSDVDMLDNTTFVRSNTATSGGGGVYLSSGSTLLVDDFATVDQNTASYGAGVRPNGTGDVLTVGRDGAINDNDATGIGGGGIYGSGGSLIDLEPGADVIGNSSTAFGGGIVVFGTLQTGDSSSGTPVLINNNEAATDGGGLYLRGTSTLNTTRMISNSAATGGAMNAVNTTVNVIETTPCQASNLGFERYCNEFRTNTATASGAAIYLGGSAQLNIDGAGFVGNASPNGVVRLEGSSVSTIRSSMVLDNEVPGSKGIFTSAGTATVNVRAVTFADNNNRAMDTDASTVTWSVNRTFSDTGAYGLGSSVSGSCNQKSPGSPGTLPGSYVAADPRFENNGDTAYMPSPRGPLADKCAILGGSTRDAHSETVKDADGSASSFEYDIGGIEAERQPLVKPGGVAQYEGDSGFTTFTFPVTLEYAIAETVTIDWATIDTNTTPDAEVVSDYLSASGTVTFLPGQTVQYVDIQVRGDTVSEPGTYLGEWLAIAFGNVSENAEQDYSFLFGLGLIIIGNDD